MNQNSAKTRSHADESTGRKLKYGSLAVLLTVVVLAALVLLNVVVSALGDAFMWQIDMSKKQVYELSDEARTVLDGIEETGCEIKILFCMPFDKLEENLYQKQVYTLARQMEVEYDFITVDYIDIITYPTLAEPYTVSAASKVTQQSVILTDGTNSRVLALEAFYVFDEDSGNVFGFQGEYKYLSMMLQLTGEHPIAAFTVGHGEETETSSLYELFESAGYEVRTVDLTYDEIDEKTQVLIVNGPKYDFSGASGEVNEIEKVDRFLDDFGNLMLFADPGTVPDLPELCEFLEEWGIGFTDAVIKDAADSVSVDHTALVAQYTAEGTGASLHRELRKLASTPKTIVRYAMPLEILWQSRNSRQVSAVLTTTPSAVACSCEDEDIVVKKGPFNLSLLSTEAQIIDNEDYFNYVFVTGTSQFADDAYLHNASYGNSDILYSVMKAMGKTTVPCDIDMKVFDDESLDITTSEANTWTVVLMTVVPALVCIVGAAVYIRRRHL